MNELAVMRRAQEAAEKELRQIREQKRVSSDEFKTSQAKVRIVEQQVCSFLFFLLNFFLKFYIISSNNN